jgi:hypothetical protein
MLRSCREIGCRLARAFQKHGSEWLAREYLGKPWAPIRFVLKPERQEVLGDIAAYRAWLESWKRIAADCPQEVRLESEPVRWLQAGIRETLAAVEVLGARGAFALMPEGPALARRYARALVRLRGASPCLAAALLHQTGFLMESEPDEFDRLCVAVTWLSRHEKAGCFVRELPIEGVDSKWLERNRSLAAPILTEMMGLAEPLRAADIETRWALRTPSPLIRVRHADILVPGLPAEAMVALPPEVFEAAIRPPRRVAVLENLQTGLSIRVRPDTLVVIGMGAAVDMLARVSWMKHTCIRYMGDLDQHGLAILARLRGWLHGVQSVLMDRSAAERFAHLAVADPTREIPCPAEGLTESELALWDYLRSGRLRLEQERIPIAILNEAFAS